jgi:hypothetical protein
MLQPTHSRICVFLTFYWQHPHYQYRQQLETAFPLPQVDLFSHSHHEQIHLVNDDNGPWGTPPSTLHRSVDQATWPPHTRL